MYLARDEIKADSFLSQKQVQDCPAKIVINTGTRGTGKSRGQLACFMKDVEKYGDAYHGIIFRQEYKELSQLIDESKIVIPKYFRTAIWLKTESQWSFPSGSTLKLHHAKDERDATKYQGHQYSFIGIDELTNYKNLDFFDSIKGSNRSKDPNVRCRMLITCNPYGSSHNIIKRRFIDPAEPYAIFKENGITHCHIPSYFAENKHILNQTDYIKTLLSDTNLNRRRAWVFNDWNISSGGVIDDLFQKAVHIVDRINSQELRDYFISSVVLDWGSVKPYAVCFVAKCIQPFTSKNGKSYIKNDILIFDEIYGSESVSSNKGTQEVPKDVQEKILSKIRVNNYKIRNYIADPQIFQDHGVPSIASYMDKLYFKSAKKGKDSRIIGLQLLRQRLKDSDPLNYPMKFREKGGLFVQRNCIHWIATTPNLQRCKINPDDADSDGEDHLYDCTRYFLQTKQDMSLVIKSL